MKIAVGGSRKLPRGVASRALVRFLASLPQGTTILLRRGIYTQPGPFEQEVAELCDYLQLPVAWCEPRPTEKVQGRGSVFVRDMDMVAEADLVLTFVAAGEAEYESSGTRHLMEKAFEADRPLYGYTVTEDGLSVERWGDNDPDDQWVDRVPYPD